MSALLLDTCAAIWVLKNAPLSDLAVNALDEASDTGQAVFVSPITAWEFGLQQARGRAAIALEPRVIFAKLTEIPGVRQAALTPEVLITSADLPDCDNRDPADRILIATAREYGMRIVTRDRKILEYADKGHVLALAC
jgi:PIN domain nuclease of toxin-antitoxin system